MLLMLTSVLVALVGPASPVMAANETTSGIITGTEVWTGTHVLTGDVAVAAGAKLIIQPGTTITFPNGTSLDVRGNLCAGVSSCGANGNAGTATPITLTWLEPSQSNATGECYGLGSGNSKIWIRDSSCGEGMILRDTMDLSQSGMRHMHFEGAWGIPFYIQLEFEYRFGVLILDGASPTLREMVFNDINTTSVLATNLAQPRFIGGDYIAGNDAESDVTGQAVQIYGGGTPISPMVFEDARFTSTNNGCGRRDGGRAAIWASQTFIEIDGSEVASGDFGFSIRNSAGKITNSEISVNCNGIDVNSLKAIANTEYNLEIAYNDITTIEGSPITAYAGANVNIHNNNLEGASEGSGIAVYSSRANIQNNEIGPIGGWNGLWLLGSYDVIAEHNTIVDTQREPILAGEYGTQAPAPTTARLYLANNTISTAGTGACSSSRWWDGSFTCPAIMIHRTGATILDNVINAAGSADGIRATGGILDVRRNIFNVPATGAILQNYDSGFAGEQQYGTLAFFSNNVWNGVEVTYNVTKSSVTVQSEYIPSPPPGQYPVILSWSDQEAWSHNQWQSGIIPHDVRACATCEDFTPHDFPLAVNMDNNSTIFTFSNLSNIDLSKVFINTLPTRYAVQVQRAELVRLQTLINGERVEDVNVLIEDAHGNDIYSLETDADGYTPWFSLASNFHLDFRGLEGGDNPDNFADDEYEDSCSDGVDNDGDLLTDTDDPDCDHNAGTRELSLYRYTAYRFGFGFDNGEFTLTDTTYQDTLFLENLAPSVAVTQSDGHSYRRVVNLTGSAYDGQWAGIYSTDELAQWDQRGYVHRVEIKDPFTSEWAPAGHATDASGAAEGSVTRNNHPFSSWYYLIDMSDRQEGDYTFEFRSFDGLDYSPIITRTIKLNTEAPTLTVTSPSSQSTHADGTVSFEGAAYDSYGCPFACGSDIDNIYIQIDGPNYHVVTSTSGSTEWSWTWDFSGLPRELSVYTFSIWASDSDFCNGEVDECEAVILELNIDNQNSRPFVSLISPQNGQIYSVGTETIIQGVARDNDGTITRVDIEVLDVANGYINIYSSAVTDILPNGAWVDEWDSRVMVHNMQYLIRVRSYDGYDFSDWTEAQIVADNPPDAGNNRPTFDSTGWQPEVNLYCEMESQSQDRCTKAELDLLQFFDDQDGVQHLILSVYDDESRTSDDLYGLVINVGTDGIAIYNPISMFFYDADINTWSLQNVIFVATDQHGSKEISSPVTFNVIPIRFTVEDPDSTTAGRYDTITFTGIGLPGKTVKVTLDGTQVNSTVVREDSSWTLGIPGSMLSETVTPVFSIAGSDPIMGAAISPPSESGEMSLFTIILIVFVILGLLGGAAYFLLEFEDEDDEDEGLDAKQEVVEEVVDTYAWGKAEESTESSPPEFVRSDDNPGWMWDPVKEEWVPDPDHNE